MIYNNYKSLMDIDFVELQHRQNVMKLMQVCNLDMAQAYELYTNCDNNFEAAVNRHYNPVPVEQPIPHQVQPNNEEVYDPYGGMDEFQEGGYDQFDNDVPYQRYKKFLKGGITFDKKFPIKKKEGFLESLIPKFIKGEQETFKTELQSYISKKTTLKIEQGNLSEAFHAIHKDKFPLAIFVLNFKNDMKETVRAIITDHLLTDKILNVQFRNYGININKYELQPQLTKFVNYQRDNNHLLICRVDNIDEIVVMDRITLMLPLDNIKTRIRHAKSQSIQLQLQEMQIQKQFAEQRKGNFNYQRPKTIKENKKMKEDNKLRKQQEEEYFKSCMPNTKEETKPEEAKKESNQEVKNQVKQVKQQPKVEQKRIKRMTRRQWRQNLKIYSEGYRLKIRVPSGKNLIINVDSTQKVQYLFDYVQSQEDDIGFEQVGIRKFDIIVGFGSNQTLKGKENQTIKDTIQDSETLIVKELSD